MSDVPDTIPAPAPDTSEWSDRRLLEEIFQRQLDLAVAQSVQGRELAEVKRQLNMGEPRDPRTIAQHVQELQNSVTFLVEEQQRATLRKPFTEIESELERVSAIP